MSILSDTAPKRIWLCVSDEVDDYSLSYPELYAEDAEITWSTDQPVAVTIEYVREDLSELARLRHDIERHVAITAEQAQTIVQLESMYRICGDERTTLRAELGAVRALLMSLRPIVRCEALDHRKADQHGGFSPCPVETRMKDAIDAALAAPESSP